MSTGFKLERARAIARKEVYHILRDPFTLILALVFPIFMVVMYGLAMDFNLKNIALSVADADETQTSRELLDTFSSSHYFLLRSAGSPADAVADVQGERGKATLIIPPDFEKNLFAGRQAQAQVLIDGADNSAVGSILAYTAKIERIASQRIAGQAMRQELDLRTRFLFNPELNSSWFVIPGLVVVVMAILSILLTSLTVAREWENGSMELLLSTPVQPLEIIVGKLAPYGVLGILAITMTYIVARAGFGVPFQGSLWVFGLGSVIFLCTYLAQGLLISVVARNQQVAMQMAMISGLLPSNLLSGFVFPVASMPIFFRYFTMILPARWFMQISRFTFLRGSSMAQLWMAFLALALLCGGMIRMATSRFKRDLEP
jgi:ABC-2 type transport system permease protein